MALSHSDPNMGKVLLLTSNFPGSDALHDEIIQIYDQTGDWSRIAAVVNNFMNQLVSQYETGVSGVAQAIFDNGLGIKLSITQIEQLVVDFIRQGIDSWSRFFEFVITDTGGELGGILDGRVKDLDAPKLLTSLPTDDATLVPIDSNLVLTFDENVMAGVGDIMIRDEAGDNRVIAVTDTSQVTFKDNTVTINPANNLILGRTYSMQMASGVIVDMGNHSYAGISDTTTLNFATIPPPPPTGLTFVLTPGTESLLGTSDSAILEIVDVGTITPTITNVEVIDITVLSNKNSGLDMSHVASATRTITISAQATGQFSLVNAGPVNNVTITGTSDLSLSITGLTATNTKIDASASTGKIQLDLSSIVNNLSVVGGSGNNKIIVGSGVDKISGGAGKDTFDFGPGTSGLALGAIDIVTDFVSGVDSLDFHRAPGNVTRNFTDAGGAADYAAALAAANQIMQVPKGNYFVSYVFADNAINGWVFVDTNSDRVVDLSVQLSGVTAIVDTDIIGVS